MLKSGQFHVVDPGPDIEFPAAFSVRFQVSVTEHWGRFGPLRFVITKLTFMRTAVPLIVPFPPTTTPYLMPLTVT